VARVVVSKYWVEEQGNVGGDREAGRGVHSMAAGPQIQIRSSKDASSELIKINRSMSTRRNEAEEENGSFIRVAVRVRPLLKKEILSGLRMTKLVTDEDENSLS